MMYLRRKKVVEERIDKMKTKIDDQKEKLKELQETNKYFYGLRSPSPYMVAQQQYLKR